MKLIIGKKRWEISKKPKMFSYILNKNEIEEMDQLGREQNKLTLDISTSHTIEIKDHYSDLYEKLLKKKQNFIYYLVQLYAPDEYKKMRYPIPLIWCEQLKKITFICKENTEI